MVLADLGADVIKVERPDEGDDTRHWGPPFAGDDAAYFLSLNRNKRSVTADLGSPEGVSFVRRLVVTSDVVIENFRPGLMERFGLGLDDLREAQPRLVTCSLTAFGPAATRDRLATRLRHHRAGALRADERHGRARRRADEGGSRAAGRDHRALRGGGRAGRAPRTRRHRPRTPRERRAVRRERRRHGQSGGELPDRRRGPGADGDRAPEHRAVPGVPRERPAVHPGRGQRPALRPDVQVVEHADWARRPAVRHERGDAWCIATS